MDKYFQVEARVSEREGSYKNLAAEALTTSEEDFRRIFESVPISSWVEVGSGYGQGTIIFSQLYPDRTAIGLEFEGPRVEAAQARASELKCSAKFIHADLRFCEIPVAQTYFFYFPTGPVLDRILFELGQREEDFQFIVIESHGDFLPRLKLESWLRPIQEITLSSQRHYPKAVVFKKVSKKAPSVFDLSFQDRLLLIRDDLGEWLADSRELEYLSSAEIQLKTPPRTIRRDQIVRTVTEDDLSEVVQRLLSERRQEQCWRKIYTGPKVMVEDLSGKLKEIL